MHNLVTLGYYNWSPDPYVGGFQLRAMASWTNHDICKVEAMTTYWAAKNDIKIWIREESSNPIESIFRHMIVTSNKDLIPTLIENQ